MSLSSLLSIARSALLTHQSAMAVTSHNVANANTPGFSRQRLDMSAATPLLTPFGAVGRGVTNDGAQRIRDAFLDQAFRRESGSFERSQTMRDMLGRVESVLGEPGDSGLAAMLDQFFGALGDLANDPANPTPRNLVRQAAGQVIRRFSVQNAQLQDLERETGDRMQADVGEVNRLAREIADLNARIVVSASGPGATAPDLQDARDQLVDRLSSIMAVRVLPRTDGSIGVVAGDTLLVDETGFQELSVRAATGGGFGVGLTSGSGLISLSDGRLKALSDLTTTEIPGVRAQLDQLAGALVAEVNTIHRTGFTLGGATGTDFFDPSGVTAGTLSLTVAIQSSVDAIAAGGTAAAGDGDVALQLAGLRNTGLTALGGATVGDFYAGVVTGVAGKVQGATQDAAVGDTVVTNIDSRRAAVSGVSIEEEMVNLISQQQAFSAASRLVNVADEMMQDILRMV